MNNIQDLNIENEILPIFDYSLNSFTKNKILEILETPLKYEDKILERQNILKGFASNIEILNNYSYTVIYINEVHFFLNNYKIDHIKKKWLIFFKADTNDILFKNKIHQLILFFHRLESIYFSRINIKSFPESYQQDIKRILMFLSFFELRKYEEIIREKRLKNKHIKEITDKISRLKSENKIDTFWEDLFLFESYLSINKTIIERKFVFPTFQNKGLCLIDLYHPLIKNPIKNNLIVKSNVIVLNGPNMSGKSTFLKSVSLCVYLGNLGLGIPALKGIIPVFTEFSIGINKRDDILNGYSHFMTEILTLKAIVLKATEEKKCFAVFDELFSGTNIQDALEICRTTINGLSSYPHSFFFISTHIQELKNLTNDNISTYFLDCDLIENIPTFTYKLKEGWSDIKIGRILFEKEGLNKLLNH